MGRTRRGGHRGWPVVGLDIGRRTIKMSRLDLTDPVPAVLAIGQTATPAGLFDSAGLTSRDALTDCLRQLADELGIRAGGALTAVGGDQLHLATLDLEPVPAEALPAAVQAALAPATAGWGDAVVTWQALPSEPAAEPLAPRLRLAACAAPRRLIDDLTWALERARLEPLVIDAEPFAASYLLVAHAVDPGWREATVILGDFGASHATWTRVTAGWAMQCLRTPHGGDAVTAALTAALGLDRAAAERHKLASLDLTWLADGQPEHAAVEPLLDAWTAGLAEVCDGETSPPAAVLLYGGGALLRGLAPLLAERSGLPVRLPSTFEAFDAATRSSLPPGIVRDGVSFVTSLGLAWRQATVEC